MGKGKLGKKAKDAVTGNGAAAAKDAKKGEEAAEALRETAEAAKRGRLARAGDFAKNHKVATGVGALGALGLGSYGYGKVFGDNDNDSGRRTASDTPNILTAPATTGDLSADGWAENGAIVRMDTEVVRSLAASLRRQGDAATALAQSAPSVFDTYRSWLARDLLGVGTRDGKASPIIADYDAAIAEAQRLYIANAEALATQFHNDAAKLLKVAADWETMEEDNAAAFDNADVNVTPTTPSVTTPLINV
ncbi:hypothetical protein [Mycobacteroides abscessus]|uniref:hypothetical protein n=1 Tax=Mycobacteroides abscessus TaxID=36809 RepID=UPI00092A3711|nr:hypothetical protein [Mycobacteroides abscessus]SIF35746.1 Uncharacterised protein [Mycobacteroides abscessus subsp. abscessus]